MGRSLLKPSPWFIELAGAKLPVKLELSSRKQADRLRRQFYAMRQRVNDQSPWEHIKVRVTDNVVEFCYGASQDLYDTAKLLTEHQTEADGSKLEAMLEERHGKFKDGQ